MNWLGYTGLCAAWLVAAGCHAGLLDDGEFTRSQCSDGADNDVDQKIDCEEASCQVFRMCRERAPMDAAMRSADGGVQDADAAIRDAATQDARTKHPLMDATMKDARVPVATDAGRCPGATQPCRPDEACLDAGCVAVFPRGFRVHVSSATVPSEKPTTDGGTECYDERCERLAGCTCEAPDPFVRVVSAPPGGVRIPESGDHWTPTQRNTTTPNWTIEEIEAIPVIINSLDHTLVLEVRDDDTVFGLDRTTAGAQELIFACSFKVDPKQMPEQRLSCSPMVGDTTATLEASIELGPAL